MNTKGITGHSQVGPLKTEKPGLNSGLISPKDSNKSESAAKAANSYGVNLSSEARQMADAHAKALDIARNTSDVREERIAELRNRIKSGQYKVDSGKIADGMLNEAIKDEVATQMHNEAKSR